MLRILVIVLRVLIIVLGVRWLRAKYESRGFGVFCYSTQHMSQRITLLAATPSRAQNQCKLAVRCRTARKRARKTDVRTGE